MGAAERVGPAGVTLLLAIARSDERLSGWRGGSSTSPIAEREPRGSSVRLAVCRRGRRYFLPATRFLFEQQRPRQCAGFSVKLTVELGAAEESRSILLLKRLSRDRVPGIQL